jgi:N-acetylmuramoyl-L-alanine amidase
VFDVILTRSTDRFIPLEERTAIANQTGADLFISIHANASRNRRAYGIETYVLDFATTPAEIEIASRENAGSQRNIRELEDLLRQIAKGDFNKESRDLAQTVQTRLVSGLQTDAVKQIDRGVKQGALHRSNRIEYAEYPHRDRIHQQSGPRTLLQDPRGSKPGGGKPPSGY